MAVNVTKTKVRKLSKEAAGNLKAKKILTGAILADEYGEAHQAVENVKPVLKQFESVKDKLKAFMAANYKPTETTTLTGDIYQIEVGVCAKEPAAIKDGGLKRVLEMVGEETFFQIANITLKDLRAYLTPEQLTEVLNEDTEYTEKRSITVTKVEASV